MNTSSDTSGRPGSAEQTRLALIRAGLRLFGQKGFEATSTREIASAARANIGSIAYHFGGKEGLRTACAEHIVKTVGGLAATALHGIGPDDIATATPQEAEALLTRALETMIGFIVARPEAGEIVQFVLRELSRPTNALDIIYDGFFLPVHRTLCGIWAAATGEPAESDRTKLTVFTLVGQVIYFRIGREAVKRRMGWADIGRSEADAVIEIVRANVGTILAARREERS